MWSYLIWTGVILAALTLVSIRAWPVLSPAMQLKVSGFAGDHWPKVLIAVVVLIALWFIPWGKLPEWLTVATVGALVWPYFIILVITLAVIYGLMVGLLPEKAKKALMPLFGVIVVLLVFSWAYWGWTSSSTTTPKTVAVGGVPLASKPQAEWLQLSVPAGGESEFVPRPPGMHLMMAGTSRFSHTMVYQDGTRCSYPNKCPDRSTGSVARNLENTTILVSVAVAPD